MRACAALYHFSLRVSFTVLLNTITKTFLQAVSVLYMDYESEKPPKEMFYAWVFSNRLRGCCPGHHFSYRKREMIRKHHLRRLARTVTDHKFLRPDMVRQSIADFSGIRLKFLRHRNPRCGFCVCQWRVKQVKRYSISFIFYFQTLRQ